MHRTPYGHRIYSKDRKGFCMILRPTPELWTNSLPHRTQVHAAQTTFAPSNLAPLPPPTLALHSLHPHLTVLLHETHALNPIPYTLYPIP